MKPNVIIITGPTASGKTALSIELAKKINGEIICADSMQVYLDMTIGTAKPTIEEMEGIQHYLIDVVKPSEEFNVVKFKILAEKYIEEILCKNKTPIIVGGTGLYIESLIKNIDFSNTEIDTEYRDSLYEISNKEGNEQLYNMILKIDPEATKEIHINNTKRIIRALEIYHNTGKTKTENDKLALNNETKYTYYLFGIDMLRELLYARINKRVDIMINNGLINEVENLLKKYDKFPTAMQGLGYKEVVSYLNNEITYEEMIEVIKQETRRYAKRQLTWFKRYKNMLWLPSKIESVDKIIEIVNKGENNE